MKPAPLVFLALLSGCGTADTPKMQDSGQAAVSDSPALYCPGDPSGICDSNDGEFFAGAGAATVTPTCFEGWDDVDEDGELDSDEAFFDCGCDRLCEGDEGYPGPDDGEEDGDFQASWMAGFHNGRPANGVHDDLWARAIIFEQGDTRVGLVVLDVVGWFNQEVLTTRALADEAGLDLDHLIVASTHNHESPDTMGLWGKTETRTGYDPDYAAYIRRQTVEALQQASADLRPVGRFVIGNADITTYADNGASLLLRDSRDPKVIDENFGAALIEDTDGNTIATLTHFGNHPEAMADENVLITSDFPGPLRDALEQGVSYESGYSRDGYGGVSIFINGPVGGLMTPLGITVVDRDGTEWRPYTFERLDAMGKVMAEMAMDAIEAGEEITPSLATANVRFRLPVENYGFQAMFLSGILDRETFDWDSTQVIDEDNMPTVDTEMSWLQVGPLELLTVPGELFPELAIGGYDGSHVGDPNNAVVDDDNPNPPDLSTAPEPPYLEDRLSGSMQWIIGLGNDQLGYIVPPYDFVLDDTNPWFDQAEGDHYEETNSLGPQTAPLIDAEAQALIEWVDTNLR